MRLKYLIALLIVSFVFSFKAMAQWDAQISQYWKFKTFFNPSFVAESDTLQASILNRQQWIGIDNAPKTLIASADMPLHFLERKHGVGILFMKESIGLFSNTSIGGQYTYKKQWKKNVLNIGLQVSYVSVGFDASRIIIPEDQKESIEALPTADAESVAFDANIGVSWITPKYYVGISSTHITEPKFDIDDNFSSYIPRIYYFTAGYNVKFRNPMYEFRPSVLIKSDVTVTQYDFTARLVYNKMFNGGVTWRKDDGFVFLLGANILGFDAGYAFDLSTSEISKASKGTHEFFLRYTIPMIKSKKGQNRHKSVRIL